MTVVEELKELVKDLVNQDGMASINVELVHSDVATIFAASKRAEVCMNHLYCQPMSVDHIVELNVATVTVSELLWGACCSTTCASTLYCSDRPCVWRDVCKIRLLSLLSCVTRTTTSAVSRFIPNR
jgi:hypothetical protein